MLTEKAPTPVKRRSKGERTKLLIVESAIKILAEHGIKGTTHRAIASHANIQLSFTTYYFKDIQELVQQAFALNSHNTTKTIEPLWQPILSIVNAKTKLALRKVSIRVELREQLTDLLLKLILENTKKNRPQLIVEQQLFTEIQLSPSLRFIVEQLDDAQLAPCLQLCQYFSKDMANVNAQLLLTLVRQIQYRQLLAESSTVNIANIRSLLNQTLAIVLALKP